MKKDNYIRLFAGILIFALGILGVLFTRAAAIGENATTANKFFFAISLILALLGPVTAIAGCLPSGKQANTRTMTMAAMFAALCYIGFTFFKIDIAVGTEKTAFHLGNVF